MPEPTASDPGPNSTAQPGPSPDGRPTPDATVPPLPYEVTDKQTAHSGEHRPTASSLRRVMAPMRKMMRRGARRP